jgi:hypothetical protein
MPASTAISRQLHHASGHDQRERCAAIVERWNAAPTHRLKR